ncbi:MAG: glycosyltransferase family 4 protein [Candidatus Omnitrophica bacterium]|nr:glycosyltransferase family 4 protein [Candidatus Omnitrophota bacterium]
MKILFWSPYPSEGASNRYRIEQYLPYLKSAGIKYDLHPFWSSKAYSLLYKEGYYFRKLYYFLLGTFSRIRDLIFIFQYGIIFIHREAYPIGGMFFETILSFLGKSIIFDFDDAIFLPASSRPNYFIERFKRPNKVSKIIKLSRHVIAGNNYLADFSLRYSNAVSVIPTPIDTDKYYPRHKDYSNELVIGWMGSITTVSFLEMLEDVFIYLSGKFNNLKFKIVGGHFSIGGLSNIQSKEWSLSEEREDLKTFDIGIMPMPDNKWTRGKCGFKAILYMGMGIPCVCSPVGVNKAIINDGENGFLADTDAEWIEKLSLLIEGPELRGKIGMQARRTAEERYSVKVNAPKFIKIIRGAMPGGEGFQVH